MEATRFYQHAREQPPPKIALLQQQPLARVLDELSAGLDQVAVSWVSGQLATRIGSATAASDSQVYRASARGMSDWAKCAGLLRSGSKRELGGASKCCQNRLEESTAVGKQSSSCTR